MSNYKNTTCPYCGKPFTESDDVVVCPDCGTPHHRDCYKEAGHCANEEKHGTFEWGTAAPSAPKTEPKASGFVICPNCGGENSAENRYCRFCGSPMASRSESSPEETFYQERRRIVVENLDNADFNGATAPEVAQVVGTNLEYFLLRFLGFSKGRKFDTNFCAFFFSYLYLFYRKMYGWGAAVMAATLILQIPATLLDFQSLQEAYIDAGLLTQFIWQVPHLDTLLVLATVGSILIWFIRVGLFLFANRLYYHHVTAIARGIRDGLKEQGTYSDGLFSQLARKKGGTTMIPIVLILACSVLIGVFLAFFTMSSPIFVFPTIPR